jgi:hypothetical protein
MRSQKKVVGSKTKRAVMNYLKEEHKISERQAYKIVQLSKILAKDWRKNYNEWKHHNSLGRTN